MNQQKTQRVLVSCGLSRPQMSRKLTGHLWLTRFPPHIEELLVVNPSVIHSSVLLYITVIEYLLARHPPLEFHALPMFSLGLGTED